MSQKNLKNVVGPLGLISMLSFMLLIFRIPLSGRLTFIFLGWNIILAWMPYLLSLTILRRHQQKKSLLVTLALAALWLLFLPNAPYIITDFVHFHSSAAVPIWYDMLLLVCAAWTGLMLGLCSLFNIHCWLRDILTSSLSWVAVTLISFAAAFGVWLGRFERWNSWDIILKPRPLLYQIMTTFRHPYHHQETVGLTVLFGLFLIAAYFTVWFMSEPKNKYHQN